MDRGIKIVGETLREFNANINKEYLITNGMGSFSSACPNGNYSRQYHGLFIRSFHSPINRYVALYKVEEVFKGKNLGVQKVIEKGEHKVYDGDKYLYSFTQTPFPKQKYIVDNNYLEKEIIMGHMRDLVGVKYYTNSTEEFTSELFMNFRDAHVLNEEPIRDYHIEKEEYGYSVTLNGEKMYIYTDGILEVVTEDEESENFFGEVENQVIRKRIVYDLAINDRGEKSLDSCKKTFRIRFAGKNSYEFIASFEKLDRDETLDKIREKEIERLRNLVENSKGGKDIDDSFYNDLVISSDAFVSHKASTGGKTIIAGYPWFNDWGRDTMIAFTGLVLSTRRFEDGKSILRTFKKYCSEGMLPNNFPDSEGDQPIYNTIDGTLWYFYGIHKYLEYTGDIDFVKDELYDTLDEIIKWHIKGTRYNIKVDEEDGLLFGGSKDTQLTWMDVKYKGYAVTPRWGKAVEINALWYNALKIFQDLSNKLGKEFAYGEYIEKIEKSFREKFVNKDGYLNDYITDLGVNSQVRPNQILAVSLPYKILTLEEEKKVVDRVKADLLTPYGLRTLSREDKEYIGRYEGSLYKRDIAYHQGTVWTWIYGHFIEAYSNVYPEADLGIFFEEIKNHFYNDSGLGSISEIFDGDEPFRGRGCYAQAWSVGEILRVYKERYI